MSSETTELTFVRCPSCRSLVPATATRCRICNNPLDGGSKADESDAARAAARIRQKTISASADEVTSALAEVKGEYASTPVTQPPPAVPEPVSGATTSEDADVDFDPLGAYLQELEEAEELAGEEPLGAVQEPAAASAVQKEIDDDELDPLGLDIFDELDDEPEPKPIAPKPMAAPPPPTPSRAESGPVVVSAAPAFDTPVETEGSPEPVRASKPMDPPASKPPQEGRRPFGMAPQSGRLGGSSDVSRPERHGDRRQNEPKQRDEHPHEQRRAKDGQHQRPNQHNGQQGKRDGRGDARPEARPEARHDAPKGKQGGNEPRSEQRGEGRTTDHSTAAAQRPAKVNAGKLFGWFVSYENPDGRAIELREGKCFITGNSIRATDLVIEDSSISTPHALMSISGEAGLKVQDLMSERGLFVRSRDGGQYRREDGTLELKHGDWIRFGDVEFLVTLVPTGTRK